MVIPGQAQRELERVRAEIAALQRDIAETEKKPPRIVEPKEPPKPAPRRESSARVPPPQARIAVPPRAAQLPPPPTAVPEVFPATYQTTTSTSVLASAAFGAPVIANLPSLTPLTVVGRSGDWLKIRARSGQQGFVRSADARRAP